MKRKILYGLAIFIFLIIAAANAPQKGNTSHKKELQDNVVQKEEVKHSNYKEITISKKTYKKIYPFTVDKVKLGCYYENNTVMPVVIINGKSYGLTGLADMQHGQNNIHALDKYWAKDKRPMMKGLRLDLDYVTKDAKSLCDSLKNN